FEGMEISQLVKPTIEECTKVIEVTEQQEEYDQHAKVRQSFLRSIELQCKDDVLKEHVSVSKDQIYNLEHISISNQLVEDEVLSNLEGSDDEEESIEVVSITPTSPIFLHEESNMMFAKDE
ncbi:hypothetical protein KI387_041575, partial [Taxus chinensis]